jgi:ADP-ribose pyrophosphatase
MVADSYRFDRRSVSSVLGYERVYRRPPAVPRMSDDTARRRWRVLRSEYVVDTRYLRLRRDCIELPSGAQIDDYFVRESRGFAVVFAMTRDDRVVLVRQYKHGIGEGVLELPAGAIDEGETPLGCARRELAEETGFIAGPAGLELVKTFITDPTNSDSRFHLFLATGARQLAEQRPDPTEEISVEFATLAELRRFVLDGTIDVSSHVASIYFMLDRLGRL